MAVYSTYALSGKIACERDGGHHRPNHAANSAQKIFPILEGYIRSSESVAHSRIHDWELELNCFFARQLLPWLPSYDSQFTCAVPLTRIRDIAHRNDISQSLKNEIKTTLQNKLHASCGPEDLITATKLLSRFELAPNDYPSDFLAEFRTFYAVSLIIESAIFDFQELQAFFNNTNLVDLITDLGRTIPSLEGASAQFLQSKDDTLSSLMAASILRQALTTELELTPMDQPAAQKL